jgi:hypothetical protein
MDPHTSEGETYLNSPNNGTISVVRRAVLSYLPAPAWKVFVDGTWVGDVTPRKKADFEVNPGKHSVKIWSTRGARCSNELKLDVAVGSKRTLECRATMTPLGVSRLPDQVGVIRDSVKDGVTRSLSLWEVK